MPRGKSVTKTERTRELEKLERAHEKAKRARKRYDVDRPGIFNYMGEFGSGKSLSAAADCVPAYARGIDVFHNDSLYFGEQLDLARFRSGNYENCLIYIDELQELMDSLRTMTNMQLDVIGVMIGLRHQNVQIVGTGQELDELNRRFVRRTYMRIHCYNNDGGHNIFQVRTRHPGQGRRERSIRVLARGMRRFWPYYNTYRKIRVGQYRKSAREDRAEKETALSRAVLEIIAGSEVSGLKELSSTQVQVVLKESYEIVETTSKIATSLAGFGCEYKHRQKGNFWIIPPNFAEIWAPELAS